MRTRGERLVAWASAQAVAAGGSLPELAALGFVAAACAGLAPRLELLRAVAWTVLLAVGWGALEQLDRHPRVRAWRGSRVVRALGAIAPPALLFGTSMWMLWPIWNGDERAFLDQDNATHVERARVFWSAVSHGRWPHWTHLLMGGEPVADAYGWLGNLLPPLFRALALGKIPFERGYVWTLCSLHGLSAVAVYALARRFSRRALAFGTGLLFIVGGHLVPYLTGDRPIWFLHLHMGLWHSLLAATLAMFAAAKLVDVVRRGRLGDALALALWVAAACLAHGFGTLAIVTILGCTAASGLLSQPAMSRRTRLGLYALACGLLLASAWTVPASRVLSEWGLRFPRPPHEDDQSLLEFVGPLSTATLLAGGVASFAALFHRDRLLRGVAMAGLSTILLDEAGIVGQLGLADSPAGRAMQWHRLTLIFVLVSTAPFAAMVDRMVDRAPRAPLAFRTVALRAIGLSVAFLFVLAPLTHTMGRGRHELKKIEVVKLDDPIAFERLTATLERLRAQDPDAFRVHFGAQTNAFASMALALRSGTPITATFHPPGQFLANRPQTNDPAELRAWGVKYLVYDAGLAVLPYWKEIERVGPYKIYRDQEFPGLVRAPKGVSIAVARFDDEELRFRVHGAPPEGVDVQVGVAFYPRFRALLEGKPLEVGRGAARKDGPEDQIRLHVSDGEVVLRPDGRLPSSRVAWAATGAGAAMWLLLLVLRVSARARTRARTLLERRTAWLEHAQASFTPERAAAAVLASLALFTLGLAQVRPISASPRPYAFFGDRHAVRRNDVECPQSKTTRRWVCGEPFESVDAEVYFSVANEPTASLWPQGDNWSALRVVEREGQSTLQVRFRKMQVSRWIHVRMAPVGIMPFSAELRVGTGKPLPIGLKHGWATVDTGQTGVSDVYVELRFASRGGLDLALASDGSSESPKLPKQ